MDTSQPNSCGIQKIIDCKINEHGHQMYKVKWEPTWEPAENLLTCQHLVDEFWSYVNNVKINEETAIQHKKKIKLEPGIDHSSFPRLSEDNKADVHQLIVRTSSTPVGANTLNSPSNMLISTNGTQVNGTQVHNFNQNSFPVKSEKLDKVNVASSIKAESTSSPSNNKIGVSGLKYLESFDNPYVKIIVVCKICNKEQSLKISGSWKQHYFTHTDQKPHTCPHCSKGFLRPVLLRNHIKAKHSAEVQMAPLNQDQMYLKQENF